MKKTRVLIEIEGGNVQRIIKDGDVEIFVHDWDNIYSADYDYVKENGVEDTVIALTGVGTGVGWSEKVSPERFDEVFKANEQKVEKQLKDVLNLFEDIDEEE